MIRKLATRIVIVAVAGCVGDDIPPPAIATVSPAHAPAGAMVTILGDYFCQQPKGEEDPLACANVGTVEFGQTPGTVAMYSEQMITAEVPGLASGSSTVAVVVAGRRSNRVEFVVDPP